jgi:hypothetical protein
MKRERTTASPAGIESDGKDLYFVFDGKRVAKRGAPGTPQARTWISLEPGYEVTGTEKIEVTFNGVAVH